MGVFDGKYEHLLTCIPLPKVYAVCVYREARRYAEQGTKGTVDFIGLVAVTAPGAGLAHGHH